MFGLGKTEKLQTKIKELTKELEIADNTIKNQEKRRQKDCEYYFEKTVEFEKSIGTLEDFMRNMKDSKGILENFFKSVILPQGYNNSITFSRNVIEIKLTSNMWGNKPKMTMEIRDNHCGSDYVVVIMDLSDNAVFDDIFYNTLISIPKLRDTVSFDKFNKHFSISMGGYRFIEVKDFLAVIVKAHDEATEKYNEIVKGKKVK